MATRLFFHDAASAVAGTLPSAEQSALTPSLTMVGAGSCRTMNSITGIAMTTAPTITGSGTLAHTAFLRTFATGKFDVDQIIGPQIWVLNLAFINNSTNMNFGPGLRAHTYIWDPATGTKRGTLFDNPVFVGMPDPGSGDTGMIGEASYSASVTVTALAGDIMVTELWSVFTPSVITGFKASIGYDGTTVTTTEISITSAASFLNLNTSTLTFQQPAISGSSAFTLAAATVAATGTLRISGSSAYTLGAATVAATGGALIAGTYGTTLANATVAATGKLAIAGTSSTTLADATDIATGTVTGGAPVVVPVVADSGSGSGASRANQRNMFRVPVEAVEPTRTLEAIFGVPEREPVKELPPSPLKSLTLAQAVRQTVLPPVPLPVIKQYTSTLPKPSPVVVEEEEYSDDDLIQLLMMVTP